MNQSCHAVAGKPRDPVGAGTFASWTRDISGSRFPANALLKSSVEGSSGSPLPLRAMVWLSGQQQLHVESQLLTLGPGGFNPSPGHGGGNAADAAP